MNDRIKPLTQSVGSQKHLVHTAMRLLRVVQHRKQIVLASLVAASLLGSLYYFTAPRMYDARTAMMLMYRGNEDALPGTDGYRQGMLPTYERLLHSSVVLEGAAASLEKMPPEERVDLINYPRDEWVEILRNNLTARAIRSTNFIEVSYVSRAPQAAVTAINAVVQSYLDFIEENQRNVATEVVTILDKGRSDIAVQLSAKERELLEAKRQIGDLGLRDGSTVTHPRVHNVVRINEALVEVKKNRMRLEASLIAIREAIAQRRDLRHFMLSMEDAGGRDMVLSMLGLSAKDEENIKQLERQLSDDRARLESVQEHYGAKHPTVTELRMNIALNEQHLTDYRSTKSERLNTMQNQNLAEMLLTTIQGKLATTAAHERQLAREFQSAQDKAVELNGRVAQVAIIEHDLRMLRELHDTLRNRIANLDIKQDQTEVRLAVVSDAKANEAHVSPRLLAVCCGSLMGGLAVGIGLAYILDVLDDRFRSADELRDQLGVSILSIVRQLPPVNAKGLESLQVHLAPNSVESESFRTLRSTLAFSDQANECVAISSSEPGDGKTTVLSNLGAAFAQAGKRTLLIDADMRRPGLTRLFGCRGVGGLSDTLRSSDDVGQLSLGRIQRTALDGLEVLPAGPLPTDPSGLLGNPRFAELVAWASDHYDQVLIDTPPVLAASDAAIVGRLASGIVLVVQPSKNHRQLVHRAVDEIRTASLDVVGVVINRIAEGPYADYAYTYGYGQGYGHGYHEDPSDELDHEGSDADVIPQHDAASIKPRRAKSMWASHDRAA